MENRLIVAFHIGRGGRFHNPGHKTYNSNVNKLSDCFDINVFINNEDFNGNPLPNDNWTLDTATGRTLLTGRAAIESPVGVLDWDGEHDTDIVKYIDDCDESELELIYKAYLDGDGGMSVDLKEYICRYKGLKRIREIDFSLTYEATIHCTDGTQLTFDWDGSHDVSEEETREWMQENNIDPVSIETHADRFADYFYVEDEG